MTRSFAHDREVVQVLAKLPTDARCALRAALTPIRDAVVYVQELADYEAAGGWPTSRDRAQAHACAQVLQVLLDEVET